MIPADYGVVLAVSPSKIMPEGVLSYNKALLGIQPMFNEIYA